MSLLSQVRPRDESESPGKDRLKRHESGSGSQDIIETMKSLLTQDQSKRDDQHKQMLTSMDGLKTQVTHLQSSIETERTTRETEVQLINERLIKIEEKDSKVFKDSIKEEVIKVLGNQRVPDTGHNDIIDGDERAKQVIVSGFDTNTDADKIVATIEDFLSTDKRRDKVVKVDTFSDPSSIGVITFCTVAAKVGFYKKVQGHTTTLDNGRTIKFVNNETYEQRVRSTTLGQIKYHLHETGGHALRDIQINRNLGTIKIKNTIVATMELGGSVVYMEAAAGVKEAVGKHMAEWIEKRARPQQ